ncbi:phage portal protein [Streptomyces sp. WMMC897]|uniref:phage portal protein n=1 Tax=Streptomyces sp. WMMC897 TaxID=3014782 RepID=UPI0022B60736|nr:phage portal protein [Streptomyces sp. WMMC897]MCZ7414305.1 phage portal protein [Streptomyces sp. WMMC897]
MGIARSVARATVGSLSGIATPEKWVTDWLSGGNVVSSGVRVDAETALTYSAWYGAVRVIAEDVAKLPLQLYERMRPRGRRRATGHPLYGLLHDAPNDMMSSVVLRETLQGHALNQGDGVAHLVLDKKTGEIEEIWPLRPDRLEVRVLRTGPGRLQRWYIYRDEVNGIYAKLPAHEVLHVGGLGFDGVRGYNPIYLAANSIGLGLATEHHGARFFGNGSRPGGVLTHPQRLSEEARKRMTADWENLHRGLDRQQRIAILEEGVTWQAVGVPNDAAQFLETRKLQVTEVARWMRLPAHKINDLERSTFSNIEQQQQDYLDNALDIWLVRWEQAILTQLLLREERERYYPEFLRAALLRGDLKARYDAYAVGRQWGWLSANDVLEMENRNPIPGGDQYLVPLNMVPVGTAPADPERAAAERGARWLRRGVESRQRIAETYAPLIAEADRKIARRQRREVRKLAVEHLEPRGRAARGVPVFIAAVRELFEGTVLEDLEALWLPIFTSFAGEIATDAVADIDGEEEPDVDLTAWARAYVTSHAAYQIASAIGQLRTIAEAADTQTDAADAVRERLEKWVEERPERTADWESKQLPNAAAREAWKGAGVQRLRWVTVGGSCPFCERLDGVVVDIVESFVAAGGEVTGLEEKLQVDRKIQHPPLHPGCDCRVVPA